MLVGLLRRSAAGFTLVELLVVMAVIGALLAIAVPAIVSQRDRANDVVAQADLRVSLPSVEAYYQDHGTYVGMTVAALRASYDQGVPATLAIASVAPASYCVQATVGGRTWKRAGPDAPVVQGAC